MTMSARIRVTGLKRSSPRRRLPSSRPGVLGACARGWSARTAPSAAVAAAWAPLLAAPLAPSACPASSASSAPSTPPAPPAPAPAGPRSPSSAPPPLTGPASWALPSGFWAGGRPRLDRSMTASPMAATKAGSWVMDTRVVPRSRAPRSRRTRPSHVPRSCPNVGSSRISRSGALMSAVATERRRFSPPDRVMGFAPARDDRPRASRCSSTRASSPGPEAPAARGPTSSSPRTVRATNWYSGSWKTMEMRPSMSRLDHLCGSSPLRSGAPWDGVTPMVPPRAGSSPARVRARVDLPTPLGPTTHVEAPRAMSRSMPSRTGAPAS